MFELVITMAIVGLVASVALPAFDPAQRPALSLAAASVADAARFARERARFYGSPHGIEIDTASQQLRVFRLNVDVDPPQQIFDVYHPASKQLYSLQLDSAPFTSVELRDISANLSSTCGVSDSLVFDAFGAVRCADPLTSRFFQATINVELDGATQSVVIDGYHGRVSVP